MVNIYEILLRAASLKEETTLNSISPERAGGIMYDTLLALNDLWLQQGSALVISKIYASVAAMEADTAPVSDLTGKPLRPGQIVVIASSDSDNGSVYRYNGADAPSWSLVGAIGSIPPVDSLDSDSTTLPLAAHQGKVLDGKIGQLGQKAIQFYPKLIQSNFVSLILPDANNALSNIIYQFSSSNKPLNMPNDVSLGDNQMLLTMDTYYEAGQIRWKHQYIYDKFYNLLYYREYNNSGWSSWTKIEEKRVIQYYKDLIVGTNYQAVVPDANNAGDFMAYIIEMSQKPANFPSDYVYSQLGGQPVVLITIPYQFSSGVRKMQIIKSFATGEVFYYRLYISSWGEWSKTIQGITTYPTTLTTSNISTHLPDANNAKENTIYKFASRTFPANFPTWFSSSSAYTNAPDISLLTESFGGTYKLQYIIDSQTGEKLWERAFYNNAWAAWSSIHHKVSVVKAYTPSNWRFNSLYEALKFAINNDNTEVEVFDGIYDLITEMGADITGTNNGILLGHNMKVKFHAKAFVTCHYEGDDDDVMSVFSPFMCGNGDFELDGLNLSASRVRYCVHDDMGQGDNQYKHIFKNCKMYLDNTNSTWNAHQCVGGGLGKNGIIEISDCIFESVGATATGEDGTPELSYHNSSVADAQSKITIKGCYFVNSGCWFGYYGSSTLITDVMVSNCSLKWLPKLRQESGSYSNINYNLMQWNNEVRS